MASPSPTRRTDRSGPTGRSSDRPPRRRPAASKSSDSYWPRRIGVALGLLAVGGTIVLAGTGALDRGNAPSASTQPSLSSSLSPSAAATTEPSPTIPVPTLEGAATVVTRERYWQVTVSVPADLPERRRNRLFVYRGDTVVAEAPLGRAGELTIEDIPLRRGENLMTAALRGPNGEGPRSEVVVVTRDDEPPSVSVNEPLPDEELYTEGVTVSGASEPGAQLTVSNGATGRSTAASVAADGSFRAEVGLVLGSNDLTVQATDAAGNVGSAQLTVVRVEGEPEARLTLSQSVFQVRRLPGSISLRVLVVDAEGTTIDAADVVFSLSPPGLPTTTYRTVTVRGEASWLDVSLPRDGAVAGEGFATARVTLADGSLVDVVTTFDFR